MRIFLNYGLTYRATIEVSEILAQFLDADRLKSELSRYQLFGQVIQKGCTFDVIAVFRGKSGEYDLPTEVKTLGIVEQSR